MTGITSTLSITKTAIAAQQAGLNITGQNIANVNNPDYSRQSAEQYAMKPALYGGFLFGTGVDTFQIQQSVDKLLEQRLTDEKSTQSSFEEQESYMRVLEGFFDENSETSINTVLTEFWNSWHDLSDNPEGSSERVAIFEAGKKLASRFETAVLDMDSLSMDMTYDISAAVGQINALAEQIADLNQEVISSEINRTANDQRDQRNRLLDELGELVNIDTFEQPDGAVIVNVANAYTIISGVDTNPVSMVEGEVAWESSSSGDLIISDKITGGKIGGLLEMRDSVVPKYQAEIDELAREMIWALNYQHSQGAGLEYFQDPVTGEYATDDSRWLTSYEFGDKIDFDQDFTMWVEDNTTSTAEYTKTTVDMGVSEASITNWQGTAPAGTQSIYRLTVVDEAVLGDKQVSEADGDGLATVMGSTADAASALNSALSEQTLSVYNGPSGTEVVNISDIGGDAKRSAYSIAQALNNIEGVSASASETSASFDIVGAGPTLLPNAQDGDEVQFTLYVDGILHQQSFTVDSSTGSLQEQFEDALLAAADAVNVIHQDQDLYADGLTITSTGGRTLGVQDFEVIDNAGVRLDAFNNFNEDDTISFWVDSSGPPATATEISVDLTGVDTTDQAQMAQVFGDALASSLSTQPLTVETDPSSNSVILRTTDGSNITLRDAGNDSGDDATFNIAPLSGTTSDIGNVDDILDFTALANDTATFNSTTSAGDDIVFYSQGTAITVNETSSVVPGDAKAAVITGTVTAVVDPDIVIQSTVFGAGTGGLFDTGNMKTGSSIMTLGGENGFSNFTVGETISFDLDGNTIDLTVSTAAGSTTDIQLAIALETELNNDLTFAGVAADYQVTRTGTSVSVIKSTTLEDPIEITNFLESDIAPLGDGNNATLQVRTGTGSATNQPENNLLESGNALRDFSTSTLYDDEGVILWERLAPDGVRTGSSGLITVEDEGSVSIVENGLTTMTFDISEGSLVAGNTLTVNTNTDGNPDPLTFRITGQANSINEIYSFRIVSGGKVGHLPATGDDPLVIEWSNSVTTGTFEIEGDDPPYTPLTPVEVNVDGMNLKFYDGTVFTDDVFTITTGESGIPVSTNSAGQPTGETQSDWHWTIDSFADQFNRRSAGMKASTTLLNQLSFEQSDSYHVMRNIEYSGDNGFAEDNVSLVVKDWSSLDFTAADLQFVRSSGTWGVLNDPTGGTMRIIPEGGDDDGFDVDFSGDGLSDMRIEFTNRVSGDGFVEFDFVKHDALDLGYAFSDDASVSSGLVAAAGINTFFKGDSAMNMEVNEALKDTKFVASATIDSETGRISEGDNTNALALADVQFQEKTMRLWTFQRGSGAESNTTTATLDDFYNQMIGSLGIKSRSIKNSKEFADIMVNSITEQRDSVSAVSLDEEMIKLMRYQHGFSAASKLLTVADEMLNTLISVR